MRINKIVVPLDTSAAAEQALPTAAAIARRLGAQLRLVLVHHQRPAAGYPDAPWHAARFGTERTYLDDKTREVAAQFGVRAVAEHPCGEPGESAIAAAQRCGADLVVMATHGRTGFARMWHGSMADRMMRALDMPVLMLRSSSGRVAPPAANAFARVLIALDGSYEAERSIEAALALAGTSAAYVLARAVAPVPMELPSADGYSALVAAPMDVDATEALVHDARQYLDRVAKGLKDREIDVELQRVGIAQHPATLLLEAAREARADLIVVASHARDTSRFILGSVVDELLNESTLPLLVCHRSAVPLGAACPAGHVEYSREASADNDAMVRRQR